MVNKVLKEDIHKEIIKENFDEKNLELLNNVEKMMYFDTERYLPDDLCVKLIEHPCFIVWRLELRF